MNPSQLLGLAVAITGGASVVDSITRRRSADALRRLAADWRMNFSLTDRLNLTSKVARHFPIPGAANLRVTNVVYGTAGDRYHYIFTAEYTIGVVRAKHRLTQAGSFAEPRGGRRTLGRSGSARVAEAAAGGAVSFAGPSAGGNPVKARVGAANQRGRAPNVPALSFH